MVYDITKPDGERVKKLEVLCKKCRVPKYEPLNNTEVYKVAVPTYLAVGGDGYDVIKNNKINHHLSGMPVKYFY